MKKARETITFAAIFTLIVTGPATLITGVILIAVSHSEWLGSVVFISIFAAELLGMFWWPRRRTAPIQRKQIARACVRVTRQDASRTAPKGENRVRP